MRWSSSIDVNLYSHVPPLVRIRPHRHLKNVVGYKRDVHMRVTTKVPTKVMMHPLIISLLFVVIILLSFMRDYIRIIRGPCPGYSFGYFCDFCGVDDIQSNDKCEPNNVTEPRCAPDHYGPPRCDFMCADACPPTLHPLHCYVSSNCSCVHLHKQTFVDTC